jgi:hypothetical protein
MASIAAGRKPEARARDRVALRWSGVALVASSWVSGALFAGYILIFYLGAPASGSMTRWNRTLPKLYEPSHPAAMVAIGGHFLAGSILLLFGPLQLIRPIRERFRTAHRWIGRIYVVCAALAGLGGLGFILAKGTVGGPVMSLGFGLYGALMALAAAQTWRFGAARLLERHRAWGIRLIALVVGSWLYRMEYGFWMPLTHGLGNNAAFTGWFDRLMAFFFYVPNLALAELFVRERAVGSAAGRWAASGALALATALTLLGTWYFAVGYWLPGIEGRA